MQVINWLELQPPPADLDALRGQLRAALPLRTVCQLLVEITLRAYPWSGRTDLIACYHPTQTYKQGQRLALLISDPQNVHPTVWQLGQVRHTKVAENAAQGRFQVVTVEIHGRQVQLAGGIPGASYPELDLSGYSSKDLAWLVRWVTDTCAAPLQATITKLIQKRQICGQLVGETFLPDQVSALSLELLQPVFARLSPGRPWVTLEEIYQGLPDLAGLARESVLPLLHAALKESPYRSLGAGRWTTPEFFHQLDRDVPLGLSVSRAHAPGWTKRDEKDLAGYDRKFMPAAARHALEELGIVERLPDLEDAPWRPSKVPVRLPALHYLHVTQAYFPVGNVLHVFAPGIRMVSVQFINGDHQPFLLDRENGLLKAVHPDELPMRILKEGIPAGTHLWLEYEGDEKYRVAPRLLPFKRMVTCKLAYLEDRRLHIEHTQTSMMYEGNPSLFRTNLRFEEIQSRFSEASRTDLSLREAAVYALQELCATDPDHRAHQLELFNAVSLQRMCSPHALALLLYTQPCFEPLGGNYFRYKPVPAEPVRIRRKRKDRLSKLWDHLLSDQVAPNPLAEERTTVGVRPESQYPVFHPAVPAQELSFLVREAETEISMPALPLVALEEDAAGQALVTMDTQPDTLLRHDDPVLLSTTDTADPASAPWRESLDRLLHSLVELENTAVSSPPVDEVASPEVSDISMEAAHEEALSFSSPFHWEPKPAWIQAPVPTKHAVSETVDARRLVYIPKIPIRPLHKQPLYRRIFFYLRGWLSRTFRKTT